MRARARARLAATARRQEPQHAQPARPHRLTLLTPGLAAVIYGLSETGNHNSVAAQSAWLSLAIGAALLAGYTVHALASRRAPIIDLRLFKARSFTASTAMLFLLMASMFGSTFLLPLYYQARHLSVSQAGLILGSLGLGKGMAMTYVGKLIDRTSAERAITLTGMTLAIAGSAPYAFAGRDVSQTLLIGALFITGLGQGAVTLAAFTATYRGLTSAQIAPATSANRILQQLGGALGTVVLAIILQHAATTHAPAAAFGHTFTWAIGLTALAVIPALALPRRPRPSPAA